jgi:hypothetical protein
VRAARDAEEEAARAAEEVGGEDRDRDRERDDDDADADVVEEEE